MISVFLRLSRFFFFVSMALVALSVASFVLFQLDLGIEFTGGSVLEFEYQESRPVLGAIRSQLAQAEIGLVSAQEIGEQAVLLRLQDLSEEEHQRVLAVLGENGQELRFESIGPVIGKELRSKALVLLSLALGVIVLYVMIAFRKTAQPTHSWQWSFAALAALVHDVLISLGVLAALGEWYGAQITIPVVVALLTVVGYSVNDTVVVFDRIRENLALKVGKEFGDTVQKSLEQTLVRSLNTSFTTLLAVLAIFFFGGETLRYFALTLAIGIAAGSWSSLFVAPALLTYKRKFGLISK